MANQPTLLQQFRSFYFQNNPKDLDEAIEYFAVFGGMGWNVDTSKPLLQLIQEKVFANYKYMHADITKITYSDKTKHSLLTGLALGDRREHSAFKRARISKEEGEEAVDSLIDSGLISVEKPQAKPLNPNEEVSNKLLFSQPFRRFWFTFISPFYKGIRDGEYEEVEKRFTNREQGFSDLIFTQLAMEVIKKNFSDDPIVKIGSYWDREIDIDIMAKTASGKVIAATCKTSNAKAKKNELTKLKEKCAQVQLTPDICIIVSKNGFSNELKVQKSASVKLLALKNFKVLLEDFSSRDLLPADGKLY